MAINYYGVTVSVMLHNGTKITGTVCHVDPTTQQLTLKNATLYFFGEPYQSPLHGIYGKDIRELVTESLANDSLQGANPETNPHLGSLLETSIPLDAPATISKHQKQDELLQINKNNHLNEQKQKEKSGKESTQKEQHTKKQHQNQELQKQKNRTQKDQLPKERPRQNQTIKEFHKKNQPQKEQTSGTQNCKHSKPKPDDMKDIENRPKEHYKKGSPPLKNKNTSEKAKKHKLVDPLQKTRFKIQTVSQLDCPTFPVESFRLIGEQHIERSKQLEEDISTRSGRGAAVLVTRALRLSSEPYNIIIVIGNNKNGLVALRMSRFLLASIQCAITIYTAHLPNERLVDSFSTEKSFLINHGVTFVERLSDIQPGFDLVVEAILHPETRLTEDMNTFSLIADAIDWVSKQPKQVISIDFPSGINADTGIPYHPKHIIYPQWTISLGAPKRGCTSLKVTGRLYLIDTGLVPYLLRQEKIDMGPVVSSGKVLVKLIYTVV